MTCKACGKSLVFNELGLSKKFACGEPYCYPCLAKKLNVPERRLHEKAEEFLRAGCLMFVKEENVS